MDAPEYKQPPLDPGFADLMARTKAQDVEAAQAGVRHDTTSLTARYGALTSGDNSMLLARYGAQLALANSGGNADLNALLGRAK